LGTWGPVWGGVPIIPALIGAIIVIFVVSLILKALRK
ncbi:TPA: GlsB/YeaQ/YmgE family stress response membrane protein, partial [Staphylococcus aureus]|nr:GlsB/YeaQ/YmgE family stress response membrane protein [Staphylococcus aureus]